MQPQRDASRVEGRICRSPDAPTLRGTAKGPAVEVFDECRIAPQCGSDLPLRCRRNLDEQSLNRKWAVRQGETTGQPLLQGQILSRENLGGEDWLGLPPSPAHAHGPPTTISP